MTTVDRKLAAILAADVVGYSRLMGLDEEGTLARVKLYFDGLIRPKVAEYRGRVVKTTGDGVLIEFHSVVDAFRCAVEIQQRADGGNVGVPADRHIQLRMGINVGDIIIDSDGDVFGDGVNIAARLEAQAEAGGICISGRARDDLRSIKVRFHDDGEVRLKNIAQPVHVYSLSAEAVRTGRLGMSKRARRNTIRAAIAAGVAIVAIAGGLLVWQRHNTNPDAFIAAEIDRVPCSWLRVAEHSTLDGEQVFALAGASRSTPDALSRQIIDDAAAKGVKIQRVETSGVAPLVPQQCGWIEKIKAYRYQGIPRLSVAGGWQRTDAGTSASLAVEVKRLKPHFQIYGISPDGSAGQLGDEIAVNAGAATADGNRTVPLNADHSGWSGLVLVESDKPIAPGTVESVLSQTVGGDQFDEIAKRDDQRFELLWVNVPQL